MGARVRRPRRRRASHPDLRDSPEEALPAVPPAGGAQGAARSRARRIHVDQRRVPRERAQRIDAGARVGVLRLAPRGSRGAAARAGAGRGRLLGPSRGGQPRGHRDRGSAVRGRSLPPRALRRALPRSLDHPDSGSPAGSRDLCRRSHARGDRRRAADPVAQARERGWPGVCLPPGGQGCRRRPPLRLSGDGGGPAGPGRDQRGAPRGAPGRLGAAGRGGSAEREAPAVRHAGPETARRVPGDVRRHVGIPGGASRGGLRGSRRGGGMGGIARAGRGGSIPSGPHP